MRVPASVISPCVGVSRPASRPSSVVLPEPDAPTMARLAPFVTSRFTPVRISIRPSGPSTALLTSTAQISLSRYHSCATASFVYFLFVAAPAFAEGPVLVLGDSLSAAYRIDPNAGWVALLSQRLKTESPPVDVVNASISGETSCRRPVAPAAAACAAQAARRRRRTRRQRCASRPAHRADPQESRRHYQVQP